MILLTLEGEDVAASQLATTPRKIWTAACGVTSTSSPDKLAGSFSFVRSPW